MLKSTNQSGVATPALRERRSSLPGVGTIRKQATCLSRQQNAGADAWANRPAHLLFGKPEVAQALAATVPIGRVLGVAVDVDRELGIARQAVQAI